MGVGAPTRELNDVAQTTTHAGAWSEAATQVGAFQIIGGLRADHLPLAERVTFDPRASVTMDAGGILVQASAGRFHQGAWRASADAPPAAGLLDIPTSAAHYTLGAQGAGGVWSATLFAKQYGDYVTRGGPPIARGSVRGTELALRRAAISGRSIDGWLTYSGTRARTVLSDASTVPGTFDVSHAVVAVATWHLSSSTQLGVTSRIATGAPYTDVTGSDSVDGGWRPQYGAVNGARYPAYARTDLRATQLVPTRAGVAAVFIEAINVLDRRNISGWSYNAEWDEKKSVEQFFARRTIVFGVDLRLNR
jgi:hypothetical protein